MGSTGPSLTKSSILVKRNLFSSVFFLMARKKRTLLGHSYGSWDPLFQENPGWFSIAIWVRIYLNLGEECGWRNHIGFIQRQDVWTTCELIFNFSSLHRCLLWFFWACASERMLRTTWSFTKAPLFTTRMCKKKAAPYKEWASWKFLTCEISFFLSLGYVQV